MEELDLTSEARQYIIGNNIAKQILRALKPTESSYLAFNIRGPVGYQNVEFVLMEGKEEKMYEGIEKAQEAFGVAIKLTDLGILDHRMLEDSHYFALRGEFQPEKTEFRYVGEFDVEIKTEKRKSLQEILNSL